MFETLSSQIGFGIAVLVVAFAFLKGDEPERIGAGAYMLALFASILMQEKTALTGTQWSLLAIDCVMLTVSMPVWRGRAAVPGRCGCAPCRH
jgi:hypothetical protein